MRKIVPAILCGGSGTRLWPLSRQEFPKQFAPVFGGRSLLDLTLRRIEALPSVDRVICITGEEHRFLVKEAVERAGRAAEILLEPAGRNTAPAIVAATLLAQRLARDPVIAFLPSDHHVPDAEAFAAAITRAAGCAAAGWWTTLGVTPGHPATGYGYIAPGPHLGQGSPARAVQRFVEKPDADAARGLIAAGCLWNAGVFVVSAEAALEAFERWLPETLAHCRDAVSASRRDGMFTRLEPGAFTACEAASIDHALLEKHDRVAVVPLEAGWSDVGSWSAFAAMTAPDGQGNSAVGDTRLDDTSGTLVYSPDRLTVAMGVCDLVIVDTADALLVASKEKSEDVRRMVASLSPRPETKAHRRVARPWGSFERIGDGPRYQVKRITVRPGAALSLQYHLHRAEHWIVVRGTARIVRGEESFFLYENESTFIAAGMRHRLENPGRVPLEIIEVQTGSYLGEDDIVRIEDDYDRHGRRSPPGET